MSTGLKLTHYPPMPHQLRRYHHLGGNQAGILPGYLVPVVDVPGEPLMRAMTATMPAYHRIIMDDPRMEMQYHLAGYGLYNEEALVKLMGESVERYAAMAAIRLFTDEFRYATRRNWPRKNPACRWSISASSPRSSRRPWPAGSTGTATGRPLRTT